MDKNHVYNISGRGMYRTDLANGGWPLFGELAFNVTNNVFDNCYTAVETLTHAFITFNVITHNQNGILLKTDQADNSSIYMNYLEDNAIMPHIKKHNSTKTINSTYNVFDGVFQQELGYRYII